MISTSHFNLFSEILLIKTREHVRRVMYAQGQRWWPTVRKWTLK